MSLHADVSVPAHDRRRLELLERLAPLIPPPRAHQARYHARPAEKGLMPFGTRVVIQAQNAPKS
jgi:hypothetical protein